MADNNRRDSYLIIWDEYMNNDMMSDVPTGPERNLERKAESPTAPPNLQLAQVSTSAMEIDMQDEPMTIDPALLTRPAPIAIMWLSPQPLEGTDYMEGIETSNQEPYDFGIPSYSPATSLLPEPGFFENVLEPMPEYFLNLDPALPPSVMRRLMLPPLTTSFSPAPPVFDTPARPSQAPWSPLSRTPLSTPSSAASSSLSPCPPSPDPASAAPQSQATASIPSATRSRAGTLTIEHRPVTRSFSVRSQAVALAETISGPIVSTSSTRRRVARAPAVIVQGFSSGTQTQPAQLAPTSTATANERVTLRRSQRIAGRRRPEI